jgi:hypothetical protein
MRRIGKLTIATALPLVALATAARAQLSGIPVYYNPRGGVGIGVAGDLGFPNTDAGGGTAYGVSGSLGAGPLTFTGMVGAWSPKGYSGQTSYGGNVAYRLLGGGFLPIAVAVQAGIGQVKMPGPVFGLSSAGTVTRTTIPVGLGIGFDPPLFPLKPWIAPRVEFTKVSGGGGSSTDFRVSAGANFNLLLGLGVHAAAEWGKIKGTTKNAIIFGVGAHFNFHVPLM